MMELKIFVKDCIHPIIFSDICDIALSVNDRSRFKNKKILISGVNGFLASYLTYFFLFLNDTYDMNCQVFGIARNRQKVENKFKSLLSRHDFKILISDLSTEIPISEKIDFIIHSASQASPKYYGVDPVGTIAPNVFGTNHLLQFGKKNQVESFLFFSSGEVYGAVNPDKIPTKESDYGYIDIGNLRSCYAEGKRLGETLCVSWFHQFGVPVKIVRPFHTYGPGMELNDGRVYADFVSNIVSNKNIVLKSKGNSMRAFCYLKDATHGFLTVLLRGKNGESYNVGNSNAECSIAELANMLIALYPEKKLCVLQEDRSNTTYMESPIQRNCPDITKMNGLGWKPSTSIVTGFKRTIESYG